MLTIPERPPTLVLAMSDSSAGDTFELHLSAWQAAQMGVDSIPVNQDGYYYHVPEHSVEVTHKYAELGLIALANELITVREYYQGIPAAGNHDGVFDKELVGTGINEERSADLVAANMSLFPAFTPEDIEASRGIIIASTFTGVNENGIVSKASPDKPNEQLFVQIDISYLGDKWPVAFAGINNYFRETDGGEPTMDNPDYRVYARDEVKLLKNQRFSVPIVEARFPHLAANSDKMQSVIEGIPVN